MSHVLERSAGPSARRPRLPADGRSESRLNICVIFTSVASTLAALRKAGHLAETLGARITILVPQVVPYPLQLNDPAVPPEFSRQQLRLIARTAPVETMVQLYLCRDRWETLADVLCPHSLVVVGGRRRWWLTAERRLANKLARAGHEVVFTETE